MSGGVDSAVAAYLLVRAGHDVRGVTSINYQASRCCDSRSILQAKAAAEHIGIPYQTIDVILPFRQKVVEAYIDGYKSGVTVNPCTICNGEIRFEEIFDEAEWQFSAEAMATGHYARIRQDPATGRWQLSRGLDPSKDQSYMLYRLRQEQLARTLFPLGELSKAEVRALAAEIGLAVANKPDSQDICFVMDGHAAFMREALGDAMVPGPIVDLAGNVLGRHEGIALYTIGQRRGLGVAAPAPMYVLRLDAATNTVIVGPRDSAGLTALVATRFNWVSLAAPTAPFAAELQVRYRTVPVPVQVTPQPDGNVHIACDEPQFGVSPGQAAVIYHGDMLLGGGVISGGG
ncbi:MAG: tRNA 2-thiouridine(34) synthase MnmA [Candidatus Sericytochromatia bacterium]|nr:tRNA 2-thiouridine(34) synthase MnmA [Candidatus Sericytochromatia bacterium]